MGYITKKEYENNTGKCVNCDKPNWECMCELEKQKIMDEIINELKHDFSGDASYLSGVNDGMYHLFRKLYEKKYL